MEKKYTIGIITGIVAIALVAAGVTLYNQSYLDILDEYPELDLFLLRFSEKSKIEVLTRTTFPDCPYGLIRIDKDEITLKCGWNIAGVYSSWTEYWRTYGQSETGEEAWWVRNNRKSRKINIDYSWQGDNMIVTRTTPFYKGRSGSDGVLTEEFIVYEDGVKISAVYAPLNKALHRIIYREDRATNLIDFDFNDPRGNYVGVEKDINFKKLYVYGEKAGTIVMDPAIVLSSPLDKGATTNITGDVITFRANCSTEGTDDIANASIYVIYNTTQGYHNVTYNDTSSYNWPNTTSIYLEETWTLPSYVDRWPYSWKVECCTNQTIANHCRFSSGRFIALNIQPNVSAPPVLTPSPSVRTDQGVTCTIDGSALQAISRSEYSYANGVTNGLVNVTYLIVNQTGGVNLTEVRNTANLSYTWAGRGLTFNLSEDYNISCMVMATDGKENSSLVESNIINVTNGRPWGLNITYPDLDFNALNGSVDDTKVFAINWTRPSQVPESDTLYYTITLDSPAGTPIYNLTGDITGASSLSENITDDGENSSTYDYWDGHLFNTSDYDTGRYYITMTVCDKNYTGETGTRGECMSDTTINTIDIFDYSVEINPNAIVNYFRLPPMGTGTRQKLIPIGQTDNSDGGIFKLDFTNGFGNLNATLALNTTGADPLSNYSLDLFCSNNTVADMMVAGRALMNTQGFNMSENPQAIYYNVGSSPKYVWCFADTYGVSAGVVLDWLFEFEVFPTPLQT